MTKFLLPYFNVISLNAIKYITLLHKIGLQFSKFGFETGSQGIKFAIRVEVGRFSLAVIWSF